MLRKNYSFISNFNQGEKGCSVVDFDYRSTSETEHEECGISPMTLNQARAAFMCLFKMKESDHNSSRGNYV